jgi:hypothetical protein
MKRRVADNDKEGIDKQIIFPTKISIPRSSPAISGRAREALQQLGPRSGQGTREPAAALRIMPAGKPEAMADELAPLRKGARVQGRAPDPYTRTQTLDEEAFYPFFAAAEELDVALMCHPNSGGPMQNMFHKKGKPPAHFPNHVLGRPFNCTMGLAGLVCGGIFEKFPKLRVVFFECSAEWILYWMHRLDDDFEFMKHWLLGLEDAALRSHPAQCLGHLRRRTKAIWTACSRNFPPRMC